MHMLSHAWPIVATRKKGCQLAGCEQNGEFDNSRQTRWSHSCPQIDVRYCRKMAMTLPWTIHSRSHSCIETKRGSIAELAGWSRT